MRFAILHGTDVISQGTITTDLDLAVDTSPRQLLVELLPLLREGDLHPVICWNYDVGGATTILLATDDAADGVQLDLVCDREGIGLDGLVTPPIVAAAVRDDRQWPRAKPVHELLYLIRKRHRKRDRVGLEQLLERARALEPKEIEVEAFRIFRSPVARALCQIVHDAPDAMPNVRRRLAPRRRVARISRRLAQPVGFWVELAPDSGGEDEARAIAARFGRFLPLARSERRAPGALGEASWMLTNVMPVRWRPGLFVSWSQDHRVRMPFQPDLRITSGETIAMMSHDIVGAMESRLFT